MALYRDIQKRIVKEKLRLEELRGQLSDLQTQVHKAEAYVSGLEDAMRLLPRDGTDDSSSVMLRPDSDMDRARGALAKSRKPLHIRELLKAIGKDDNPQARNSLSSSLRTYAKKKQVFTQPGPGTFGLIDYGPAPSSVFDPEEYDPFAEE